jgi:hypothetical protein
MNAHALPKDPSFLKGAVCDIPGDNSGVVGVQLGVGVAVAPIFLSSASGTRHSVVHRWGIHPQRVVASDILILRHPGVCVCPCCVSTGSATLVGPAAIANHLVAEHGIAFLGTPKGCARLALAEKLVFSEKAVKDRPARLNLGLEFDTY